MADRDLDDLCGYTVGEFLLGERIGQGGSAKVYRSEDPRLGRELVVKVLHQELQDDDEALQRFLREAQLASRLDHPHAAHVYSFGVDAQRRASWIAMEMVHGLTLRQWLAAHGPMPLDKFVPFFEGIAEVVQLAHDLGIIHRDLKPSNIMVLEVGGKLEPKLLDLGIAKVRNDPAAALAAGMPPPPTGASGSGLATTPEPTGGPSATPEPLTPPGAQIGSPAYMAPEQWADAAAAGRAADIYSLGIVAYEALTGDPPFVANSDDEYRACHLYDPVPKIFSPRLDAILQRALAKEPRGRHGTVLELASELRAALGASEREQIRSTAQRWDDQGRPPGLLFGGDVLANVEDGVTGALSELDCSFIAASQRRARRVRRVRRSLVGIAVAIAVGIVLAGLAYRSVTKTRTAEQLVTQAAREQGRAALLHGEPEAGPHLAKAYQRDSSSSTAFMLALALLPRLAEQARFASSSGRMLYAAFSPDGKQIVTTDDKNARVWDAQTHQLRFTLAHGDTVYHAVYSADGARIITAGGDGLVRIWDTADGSLVRKLTHPRRDGKPPRYVLVALSPDGKLVAAIDLLGEVTHVWDAGAGSPLAELRNTPSRFPTLAFSADGRWLATSGDDDVRVFDTATWKGGLTLAGPHIRSLAFDPTGPRLITGSAGGNAAIWAVPSGERLHHLRNVGESVDAVAFSPNGELVATGSHDGLVQVWEIGSGALRNQFNPRHSPILSVEFDRTSKLVLTASSDSAVVVVDAELGMPVTVLDGSADGDGTANIQAAHFDPSSRLVISASRDGTARVWDATSQYLRWSSPPISDDCGISTSLEPDRRFIAVGCKDHNTRIWDTLQDRLLAELPGVTPVDGHWPPAFPAVSAAGDRAVIARGNAMEIYELPGGRLLRTIRHGAAVRTVAFASAGHDLVSGAIDGSLLITRDGRDPIALPTSPDGIDAAGFLTDGRVVTAASKRLRVYDADRNAVLADLETSSGAMALRMSLDGRRLITIPNYTGTPAPLALWDVEHYRLVTLLEDHVGRVFSARFVGDRLLTAGADRTVRLWDGTTGRLRQTYRGDLSSRFLDATLSPNGSMIVAGGSGGLLWFWDMADDHPLWKLQAHRSHLVGLHFEGPDIVTRGFAGEVSRWRLPNPEQVIKTCDARKSCAIAKER